MSQNSGFTERVDEAYLLVSRAFRNRFRKGTAIPYITHLMAVAVTVAEHGGDEDQVVAALLHDLLEDVEGWTKADIEERFGPRVAALVEGLSDSTTPEKKGDWRPRKEAYLQKLRASPPELKLISVADKLHNARSIVRDHALVGDEVWRRFKEAGRDGTIWYYQQVLAALRHGWDHALLADLQEVVDAMGALP